MRKSSYTTHIMNFYDVVVVGAGSGGLTSAVGLAKIGKKVLLIEQDHIGGECTNSGCIPSKALLHHAKQYYLATKVSGKTTDSETFRQEAFTYVRSKIAEVLAGETAEHFRELGVAVKMGEATFTSPNSLTCGNDSYYFKKAIIATGSKPRPLSIPGLTADNTLTNQNFFLQKEIPRELVIIGGGPIGMEMGQAMAMLGSRVTIVNNGPAFAGKEDSALQPIIQKAFTDLGITIFNNAEVSRCDYTGLTIEMKQKNEKFTDIGVIPFSKILVAVGRTPNLPGGLKKAKIDATAFGITVDKNWLTSNKNIYALGDVSATLKFTHVADDIARQVVARITSYSLLSIKEKPVPKVTYTEPEIGQVGLLFEEAKEIYGEENILRIEVPFSENDRARTDDDTTGLLVIIAKRLTGKIIGAHLVGPRAGEILGSITLAMENNISLYRLRSTIFAYPTYSLVLKKAGDKFLSAQVTNLRPDLIHFFRKTGPKIFVALIWIWALTELYMYQKNFGLTAGELSLKVFEAITASAFAPLLYIMAYTIRPITFIPGTAMTILSGVFFGLWGILYTIIGANLSATLAYLVGHFFSNDGKNTKKLLSRWTNYLHEHPFLAVLMMRLTFFPFDLVAYGAGILRVSFVPFLLATALGTLLGITTFVAIGASISVEEFAKNGITVDAINFNYILISVFIFVVSHVVAEVVRRKRKLANS